MAEFQGKRVSRTWKRVLSSAERHGIDFRLNSGRRTMREQWALWRAWRNGTGNLAAFPSPIAPHIRVGLPNHAIDVDQFVGDGEAGLQRWLSRHGVPAVNNVPGEGWHLDAPLGPLLRLARKIRRRQRRRRA
jgi:hypothetical protein